jgi:hypothetical protein
MKMGSDVAYLVSDHATISPRILLESLHHPSRLRSARTYEERKTPEAMSQEPTSRA